MTENSRKSKEILKKFFKRTFHLALWDYWYEGESNKNRYWTKSKNPHEPFSLAQYKDGETTIFYNPMGIKWNINEILRLDKEGISKTPEVIKEIKKSCDKIRHLYNSPSAIEPKELAKYTKDIDKAWNYMEYMWYLIEYYEEVNETGENFKELMKIRVSEEKFAPGLNLMLDKTMKKHYPEVKEFHNILTLNEILTGKIPSKKSLEKRKKVGYFYFNKKIHEGMTREEVEKQLNCIIEGDKGSKVDVLKGNIANKGYARGKVRIIKSFTEVKDFENGEILVAHTTTPDFMPAIKKCSAMLAEEGGIISHAAITSRELDIPCVIGIKDLIFNLKTGDLVEVDANNGVVKKLD